jgi:cadmium resistance protein CadD (predicted permease)
MYNKNWRRVYEKWSLTEFDKS